MTGVSCLQVHQSFQTSMPFYGHATSQSDELFLDGWYFSHSEDGGIYTYGLYIIISYCILQILYGQTSHVWCDFLIFFVCVWYNAERHVHVAHLAPARFPWGKVKKILAIENFQKVVQSNATWREGEHGQHFLNLTSKNPQETPETYPGPVVSCKISLSLHLDERHQDFTRTSLFRWRLAALASGEYPPKMTKHFRCVCGHSSARSNPDFFDTHQRKKHG